MIRFWDQSGLGYVPPGVVVTIYAFGAAQTPTNIAATGYMGAAGTLNVTIPAGEHFVATFVGAPGQTPQYAATFISTADGTLTNVIVPSFGSPVQSPAGWANQLRTVHYPKRWIDDDVPNTPTANAWFAGLGGSIGDLDTSAQIIRTALRLPTCTGELIDSFQLDLFGNELPRIAGETDTLYLLRLMVFTGRIRMTLAVITAVVQTYLASIVNLPHGGAGLALDSSLGGVDDISGGLDVVPPATASSASGTQNNLGLDSNQGSLDSTRGALDNAALPTGSATPYVFDNQSDPASGAAVSLKDGQVCIFFKYDGYANNMPQAISVPDPMLIYLVNLVKRCGTGVKYVTNKY